jgi:DNA-binding protein HU-beta
MAGKQEIINVVAERTGLTKKQAKDAVDATFEEVKNQCSLGESVVIREFGVFKVKARAARTGRNPQTGEAIEIGAKNVLTFKPTK